MMSHYEQTRCRVGNSALRIFSTYGETIALEMYKGGFAALVVTLITLIDREKTHELFLSIIGELEPPRSVPKLVAENGRAV